MVQWLSWVKSNEKIILGILDDLAKKAVETSEVLVELFSNFEKAEDCHNKIKNLEREADGLTRSVFSELNKTFITPLDREDIQRIASKTDDVIDFIEGISGRIIRYKISSPPPYMLEIAKELTKATKEVEYMISRLKNVKGDKTIINHCRNASDIEHTIDDLYRTALAKLFETNDAVYIIKMKDIYEALETASDRCVDVADVVEDIVLKYT
ncbi:MAG: Phosphate transport regulator [Nitrosopumilales archaeon]|nr:MAG: Phosphate transport regulator [Nitrosopumilales archaeon]